MKEVLVTIPVQEEHRRYLEEIGKGMHFTYAYRKEGASREMVWRADYILGNVKPEYLPQAEKLQFLQLDSAGANEYVRPGILEFYGKTGISGRCVSDECIGGTAARFRYRCVYIIRNNGNVSSVR